MNANGERKEAEVRRRILTASTEQLQRFLVDNKDQFSHHFVLERSTNVVVD